ALAAAFRRFAVARGTAGAGEAPDLLGDAVHVDREADPAIADQRQPQFPLMPRHQARSTVAQMGRWSDAVRADALSCTPASVKRRSGVAMIRSRRATGLRAWKLRPVSAKP